MSPDDIFAAQFWTWPDPAVKRDAEGRVLFVNAAFLQLYGGQAQEWHGNAIGGWPAPQGSGQAFRFETRVPGQMGSDEQVYDWIEMSLPDGSAFCLARNVTVFMGAPDPQPGTTGPAPDQTAHTPPPAEHIAPPAQTQMTEFASTEASHTADSILSDTLTPPAAEQPVFETPPVQETIAPPVETEAQPAAEEPAHVTEAAPAAMTEPAQSPIDALIEPPEVQPEMAAEPEREVERRALPIESDSTVLGNNWRDAVIAKAVGAETPQEEAEEVEATETPKTGAKSGGDSGPIRILLAEDNAINALLTRTLLEAEGHTVETVEDGQLAVEAMKSASYDLIFMDMRMPNMDGLEATRKIRMMPNVSKDLPIIALTANAFDDDRNACFDSGMNDFMTKPVSAEELSEMVANWTSGQRQQLAS